MTLVMQHWTSPVLPQNPGFEQKHALTAVVLRMEQQTTVNNIAMLIWLISHNWLNKEVAGSDLFILCEGIYLCGLLFCGFWEGCCFNWKFNSGLKGDSWKGRADVTSVIWECFTEKLRQTEAFWTCSVTLRFRKKPCIALRSSEVWWPPTKPRKIDLFLLCFSERKGDGTCAASPRAA